MEEIIKIKCPFCGTVLKLKNEPGIEKKTMTCSSCNQKNKIGNCARTKPKAASAPPTKATSQSRNDAGKTVYAPMLNKTEGNPLGTLRLRGTNTTFQLIPGQNTIGRKSSSSGADIQIDTGSSRLMSRQHLLVEAVKKGIRGYVHYASLCRDNANPTTINGEQLLYKTDQVILNPGDIISLPDAELIFEFPDNSNATELA